MKNVGEWRRRSLIGLIVVAMVVGLYFGFRPRPVLVDMGTVSRGPMRVMSTYNPEELDWQGVDVVGEAYISDDLPSLVWTLESFPIDDRGARRAERRAEADGYDRFPHSITCRLD